MTLAALATSADSGWPGAMVMVETWPDIGGALV